MSFLYSITAFIVAIGILVTIHEFGHYWVAKKLGVKVLKFSIGFGKPLWSTRRGPDQTEYILAAIPLGGYVKMLGESESDADELSAQEKARSFSHKPVWARALIASAGPAANFLLAIVLYWFTYMAGVPDVKPVVDFVQPDSIAAAAGFRAGDRLLSADGENMDGWEEFRLYLFDKALSHETVKTEIADNDGRTKTLVLDFSRLPKTERTPGFLEKELGLYVWHPQIKPVIGAVVEGEPAARAGIKPGQTVVSIDGQEVNDWSDLVALIGPKANQTVSMRLSSADGTMETVELKPAEKTVEGRTLGRIGIGPAPLAFPEELKTSLRYGPLEAAGKAVKQVWRMSAMTLKVLGKMLTLEVSPKQISGPLTIAQYAGQSAQGGMEHFVLFLALISISLGVLNLLPIPILDGGHLLFYAIEAIKGEPVSEKVMLWGQQLGILALVGLMTLAFYNDITRLIH
ncbi:MAG: RIP metalloprotease RseP [Gammaproteobacteria bacterium]|nr:MAG: RIP metalloprotease RseP [Gammaproteobacteria bacterium]RTZ60837.1 MAG: RIP metalloprotease RseP [Gammaproteobacteria bacterium]